MPSVADFARLDERFRLPDGGMGQAAAVQGIRLRRLQAEEGEKKIHPMAFDFPRANAKKLFFPTVHIHDGKVHDKADFDHALYCQAAEPQDKKQLLHCAIRGPAEAFADIERAKKLLDPKAHVYMTTIRGMQKNQDTLV